MSDSEYFVIRCGLIIHQEAIFWKIRRKTISMCQRRAYRMCSVGDLPGKVTTICEKQETILLCKRKKYTKHWNNICQPQRNSIYLYCFACNKKILLYYDILLPIMSSRMTYISVFGKSDDAVFIKSTRQKLHLIFKDKA